MDAVKELSSIVRTCGELIAGICRSGNLGTKDKNEQLGQHYSTRADRISQSFGIKLFGKAFPGVPVVAEEEDHPNWSPPQEYIAFDPLDGTANYYNGGPYGVSACLFRKGQPVAGATYFSSDQSTVYAQKGLGCYEEVEGTTHHIRSISWHGNLDKLHVGTDIGSWAHKVGTFDAMLRPLSERFNVISPMSATEGGRMVLRGQLGGYYNIGVAKIWDAAAMSLAVQEAGGRVYAPNGSPLRWGALRCDWVMAGNYFLMDQMLRYTSPWAYAHGQE